MSPLPVIDIKKCTGCGKCVNICPKKVLYIEDGKAAAGGGDCMLCSHCFAVCDFGAVSLAEHLESPEFKTFRYSEKIFGGREIKPEMLVNIFRSRRSIRKFTDSEIDDDILRDLIEFAVTAPSGSNCQEWEFTVVNGREKVWELAVRIRDFFRKINRLASNRIARYLSLPFMGKALINYYNDHYDTVEMAIKDSESGIDLLFHGAPSLIIIHGPMDGSTPVEDATYAAYNICILAHYMGLGTCLIGFAVEALNRSSDIKNELDIYDANRVHAVIALGRPSVSFTKQSLRKKYLVEFT